MPGGASSISKCERAVLAYVDSEALTDKMFQSLLIAA
jgi:hypothetical protein